MITNWSIIHTENWPSHFHLPFHRKKLNSIPDATHTLNEIREHHLNRGLSLQSLPPTDDAWRYHVLRAHYQTSVWKKAHLANPILPEVRKCGLEIKGDDYQPIFARTFIDLKKYSGFKKCQCKNCSRSCGCIRDGRKCLSSCGCGGHCRNR